MAFSLLRVSSSPSGRPTVVPRPITQTSAPLSPIPLRRSSSTMPRGVHGRRAGDSQHQPAEVDRMQAVGVLVGIDQGECGVVVKVSWQAAAGRCIRCRRGRRSVPRSPMPAHPGWSSRATRPGSRRCRPARSLDACPRRRKRLPGSSPTRTVPRPGTMPRSASTDTRSLSSVLMVCGQGLAIKNLRRHMKPRLDQSSVEEVSRTGEVHRRSGTLHGRDDVVVTDRAARLDDG